MKGPYIGPRPFDWHDEEDASRFFGRDSEASELRFRVHANPVLVVYAHSGAGKTSLLNAKLIPDLTADAYFVLPPLRVQRVHEAGGSSAATKRSHSYHLIHSWAQLATHSEKAAALFPDVLADVLRAGSTAANDFVKLFANLPEKLQPVVILDQFEEFFTTAIFTQDQQRLFFEEIADCVQRYPSLRFVFALRSEWLALFDQCATQIPTAMRSRFYLEPLKAKAAEDAIIKPAELFGWTFAPAAAQKLTQALRSKREEVSPSRFETVEGEYIEPVQLQIVCQDIWQRVQTTNAAFKRIGEDDIGSVDDPLGAYYAKAVSHASQETGLQEWRIREWVERRLITEARTRGKVFRGADKSAGIPNPVPDELEKARLVRSERQGGTWIELVHDSFIVPILESNLKWRTQLSGAELFAQVLGTRAYNKGPLLNAVELAQANLLLGKGSAVTDESDRLLLELVKRSEAELKEQAEEAANRQRERERLQEEKQKRHTLYIVVAAAVVIGIAYLWTSTHFMEQKLALEVENRRLQQLGRSAYSYLGLQNTDQVANRDVGLLAAIDAVAGCRKVDMFVSPRYAFALAFATEWTKLDTKEPQGINTEMITMKLPGVESADGTSMLVKTKDSVALMKSDGTPAHDLKVPGDIKSMGFKADGQKFGVTRSNGKVDVWEIKKDGLVNIGDINGSLDDVLEIPKDSRSPAWFRTAPKDTPWQTSYDEIVNADLKDGISAVTNRYPTDERPKVGLSDQDLVFTDEVNEAYRMFLSGKENEAFHRLKKVFTEIKLDSDTKTVNKTFAGNLFNRARKESDVRLQQPFFSTAEKLDSEMATKITDFKNRTRKASNVEEEQKRTEVARLMEEGNSLARQGKIPEATAKYEQAIRLDPNLSRSVDPETEWRKFAPPPSSTPDSSPQ